MKKREIKFFGIKAVILMLRNHLPPVSVLEQWTTHGVKTILISPEKHLIKSLDKQPEMLSMLHATHRIHLREFRKKGTLASYFELAMILMKSSTPQTLFIVDDPSLIRTAGKKVFGKILGVSNERDHKHYYDDGADYVLESFDDLNFDSDQDHQPGFEQSIPDLLSALNGSPVKSNARQPVFFFDYDGTLTPIVKDPAKALLSDEVRELLKKLASEYIVAIISGRDMNDLKRFVGLDGLIYAGSHGFRISGPDGLYLEHEEARSLLKKLDGAESRLRSTIEQSVPGVEIERKYFAIAIHYRNAPAGMISRIRNMVDEIVFEEPEFKKGKGKKLLEIKPAIEWHKGKAIEWILGELGSKNDKTRYFPYYLGDDLTDEDAFRTIADNGLGVLVGRHGIPSAARFSLSDVSEVKQFIHQCTQAIPA